MRTSIDYAKFMAPFTIGKRKDEEEIYVNAQQISKGEFWQIPLPFTDFLVSVILLAFNFPTFSDLLDIFGAFLEAGIQTV